MEVRLLQAPAMLPARGGGTNTGGGSTGDNTGNTGTGGDDYHDPDGGTNSDE